MSDWMLVGWIASLILSAAVGRIWGYRDGMESMKRIARPKISRLIRQIEELEQSK